MLFLIAARDRVKNIIIYFINQEISAERERSIAIVSAP
jgi:hypothetical protein